MQNIKNKELSVEIIQAYAVIKSAHLFYEGFSKAKETGVEKFIIGTFIKSRENREKIGTEKTIGSFFIRK